MRIARALLISITVISITVLTACGKKGPLVLLDQATPPAPTTAASTSTPTAPTATK